MPQELTVLLPEVTRPGQAKEMPWPTESVWCNMSEKVFGFGGFFNLNSDRC